MMHSVPDPEAEVIVPPRVRPAAKPLRFPFNLIQTLVDNVALVPCQAYEEEVVLAPGPPRMAFITGPSAVETVLKTQADEFSKGHLQKSVLAPMMGNAMINCDGADWRWQRALTAPLFRYQELLRYVPVMQGAADEVIATWRQDSRGAPRAINRDMIRAAFAVISRTMLVGGANEVLTTIEKGHAAYFRNVNWLVLYRMFGLPFWLPRPGGNTMRAHERDTRASVRELIEARLSDTDKKDDLLGRLLSAGMPIERLIDNVLAFIVAGFDTTALGLSWSLYLIAQSPHWQERMRREVRDVAGDGPIGPEHLDSLVATEQVLKEALRLFPTAPIIIRDIDQEIELSGVRVPAGTIGLIPIYAIHRHKRLWRAPEKFDPARFDPDGAETLGRYSYLPFGAGPRICIGAAFTMIESKIILANAVRAARFEPDPTHSPRPTGQIFLTGNGNINIRVHPIG